MLHAYYTDWVTQAGDMRVLVGKDTCVHVLLACTYACAAGMGN
jgi:hypothetical protein